MSIRFIRANVNMVQLSSNMNVFNVREYCFRLDVFFSFHFEIDVKKWKRWLEREYLTCLHNNQRSRAMLMYRKPAREMQRMGNYDELYTMKVLRMEMRIWWICRENGMQNKHERTHTHITMTNWIGEHTMPTHYSSNLSFFFVFLSHSSILSLIRSLRFIVIQWRGNCLTFLNLIRRKIQDVWLLAGVHSGYRIYPLSLSLPPPLSLSFSLWIHSLSI